MPEICPVITVTDDEDAIPISPVSEDFCNPSSTGAAIYDGTYLWDGNIWFGYPYTETP